MEHGMNCPHHADKDEACTCAVTERTMHEAWRKRAEEADTRIAALVSQVKALTEERDAQAEAVRVLGEEVQAARVLVVPIGQPPEIVSAHRIRKVHLAVKHTRDATDANPIAAAAVKGGGE